MSKYNEDRKQAIEMLTRARDQISEVGSWTRGVYAKNQLLEGVSPVSKDAVCWCARGIMRKMVFGSGLISAEEQAEAALAEAALAEAADRIIKERGLSCGFLLNTIVFVNDNTDHETVIRMFNMAIKSLQQSLEHGNDPTDAG